MIKGITIGQYLPGDSMLHKADPRTKIILTGVYMVILFLVKSYPVFLIFALFLLLVIIGSGIPLSYTLKGLKPVVVIIMFSALINIFTVSGTPVFRYGPVRITYQGLDTAAKLALRLSLMIVSGTLILFCTTPISLTDGIEKLMTPLKLVGLPVHEIAMMMSIALRFIPTLLEETDKIMKAQASRGAEFDSGSIVQRAKSFVPVLVPLFISAFRRADDLAVAMEARCYRGSEGRTRMKQLKFCASDVKAASIMAVFAIGVLLLEYIL